MNIFVVGDEPMVEAFEVIGIPGRVLVTDQHVGELLLELAGDQSTELVLLQSSLATRLSDEYLDDLAHRLSCLVLEVPSMGEPAPDSATLLQSIQSAIGVVI